MEKTRNYGIDLLRIVSMYMVVVLHVLGRGGIVDHTEPFSASYGAAWLLEVICYCAVNCYALISGYVGVNVEYRTRRIVKLWGRVFFYSFLITVVFWILDSKTVGVKEWLDALFPVIRKQYWFITAYFLMYLCVPILNHFLNAVSQKELKKVLLQLLFVISVLQTFFVKDVFQTNNGYSAIWLMILYMVGGYIKKYGFMASKSSKWFAGAFIISTAAVWFGEYLLEYMMYQKCGEFHAYNVFLKYTSPFMVINAIALLCIFKNMKIGKNGSRLISRIEPLVLSVYLIHVHLLVWDYIMLHRFQEYLSYGAIKLIVMVLLSALVIFSICIAIDVIRIFLAKIGLKIIKVIGIGERK